LASILTSFSYNQQYPDSGAPVLTHNLMHDRLPVNNIDLLSFVVYFSS
jgi:hypothetical protein